MHVRSRKPLQDTLTAMRLKRPIAECGFALARNAEQHLRSRLRLAQLYRSEWLQASVDIADRCSFSLDELRYEYPDEIVPPGETPISHLRKLTVAGARRALPTARAASSSAAQIEKELALIEELRYEAYFLTVHDLVRFARATGDPVPGPRQGGQFGGLLLPRHHRGRTRWTPRCCSSASSRASATSRRTSTSTSSTSAAKRSSSTSTRSTASHRTALAAAVISYRTRGAVRDVGKALGIDATSHRCGVQVVPVVRRPRIACGERLRRDTASMPMRPSPGTGWS